MPFAISSKQLPLGHWIHDLWHGLKVSLYRQTTLYPPQRTLHEPSRSIPRRNGRRKALNQQEWSISYATVLRLPRLDVGSNSVKAVAVLVLEQLLHIFGFIATMAFRFRFIRGSRYPNDTVVSHPSATRPEHVTLIVDHACDKCDMEYRFSLVNTVMSWADERADIYGFDGRGTLESLILQLVSQGAQANIDFHSNETPYIVNFHSKPAHPHRHRPNAIPTPILREFRLTQRANSLSLAAIDPIAFSSLPWRDLMKISLVDVVISLDDCIEILRRCPQLRDLTVSTISNTRSIMLPETVILHQFVHPTAPQLLRTVGDRLELPQLEELSLTSKISLAPLIRIFKLPRLRNMLLDVSGSPANLKEWSPKNYVWGGMELLRDFTLRCPQLSIDEQDTVIVEATIKR
ncbi:hypothetical protein C8J56DRAFT_392854 [Mycena floridula]|nr:hypothetical protein C8J56DRAFT_392854 [Mycena floridula]